MYDIYQQSALGVKKCKVTRKDFPQNQRISPSPSHLRPEKRRHIWCGFP